MLWFYSCSLVFKTFIFKSETTDFFSGLPHTNMHLYVQVFLFLMAWLWTHILLLSKLLSTHERALQEQWGTVPSVGSAALRAHRKTSLAGLNPLWTHRPARDTSTESLVYNREHRLTKNNSKSFRLLNDENEWKHEDSYC